MFLAPPVWHGVSALLTWEWGRKGVALAQILQTPFSQGIFIDFLAQMFLHLLYALTTIPRGFKWLKFFFAPPISPRNRTVELLKLPCWKLVFF